MKALIYDGSHAGDPMAARLGDALRAQLIARGWETESLVLRDQRIGNCAGDFYCWVRSPGLCNTDDDNRLIASKMMHSDLLVYLTPVTFGGYSSALKRMVDHQIQNILPLFTTIGGEIHHQKRYAHYPNLLVVGWMDPVDAQSAAIFRHLVQRNAINMHAATSVCDVVAARGPAGGETETALADQASAWLAAIERGQSSPPVALPAASRQPSAAPVRRAVLLVGSPRTKKSTSASLGGYLMQELAGRGVETETLQIYTAFSSRERARAALAALDAADLWVLAFPLYVDALPAPVVAALETIAAGRGTAAARRVRLAAIANCGFPEAAHNATALAICAEFARTAGLDWLGGLALGGGEGLVHGEPLDALGGRAAGMRQALALAAAGLAEGHAIPPAAQAGMAKSVVPNWLYRWMGGYGWSQQARQYGMERNLRRQPYL
jgi:NAD(P)H-dependent FMN reductase